MKQIEQNIQREITKLVGQISALRYPNKTHRMQAFEINRLLKQKSNFQSSTNKELRRRIRNQLHNPLIGVHQKIRQHHRWKQIMTRTDRTNSHQTNSQLDSRHVLKLQTSDNKQQNCSSLLSQQNSFYIYHYKEITWRLPLYPGTVNTI